PETSAIYSSIFGSFGLLLVMPFIWKTPETWRDIALFCSLGVLGAIGHYFVAQSLTLAPANLVSPFQYFQLIGSVAVGYFFFGNFPDFLTWVGAAIIVVAGIWIGWSQGRAK
ncbi:MAG TPA: DMT family transporter, partial [Reyranellaceae bacterium]|nr:DMT family transporter [Reyranellaceae bacterium]